MLQCSNAVLSSGSSPNPQQIDNEVCKDYHAAIYMLKTSVLKLFMCFDQEDEKPPPLPLKKRHSLPMEPESLPDNRPSFLPLYIDDRRKAQLGLTTQDPVSVWYVEHHQFYDFSCSRVLNQRHVPLSRPSITV